MTMAAPTDSVHRQVGRNTQRSKAPEEESGKPGYAKDPASELLQQWFVMEHGLAKDRLREEAILMLLPWAHRLANRYFGMGEPPEDLRQVAAMALVRCVDKFDPAICSSIIKYANDTITGELKRYFRDKGWGTRVPRRLQELRLEIIRTRVELTQHLLRTPTVPDIAAKLGVPEDHVHEALVASSSYRPISLFAPLGNDDDGAALVDILGEPDPAFELIENSAVLRALLPTLSEHQQRIIALRFHGNLTQTQIATDIGVSQMHVSRLLSDALATLRQAMLADGPNPRRGRPASPPKKPRPAQGAPANARRKKTSTSSLPERREELSWAQRVLLELLSGGPLSAPTGNGWAQLARRMGPEWTTGSAINRTGPLLILRWVQRTGGRSCTGLALTPAGIVAATKLSDHLATLEDPK